MRVDLERAMAQEELRASQQPAPIEEELLFISNTMSSIAQGMTNAPVCERRLAEHIANKYRALHASSPNSAHPLTADRFACKNHT